MNRDKIIGAAAAAGTYFVYGINVVICKDLLNCEAASPTAILAIRLAGATTLFWLASLFAKREKVCRKDILKIFAASVMGISIPQASLLWGLTMSTPFDASMINSLKPLFAIFASFVLFKERQSGRTWLGVIAALIGVILLISAGDNLGKAFQTSPWGLAVLSMNGLSFAFYLAMFKPIIKKYSPLTFMKWCMLFALICILPFAFNDLNATNYDALEKQTYGELAFMIIVATFLTYFLSPIAQKRITPTQYCIFSYIQPLTTTLVSVIIGFDILSFQKVLAAVLMLSGAWLANTTDKHRASPTVC